MNILNNSIVTDLDTEILDGEIDQISNYLSETHYFDNEQEEELELLIAKAMKLGELYERKKWQAAKAQAVPEGLVLVPMLLSDEQYNQLEEVMHDNFGTTVSQSRDCITKIHNELVSITQQPSSTSGCPDEP